MSQRFVLVLDGPHPDLPEFERVKLQWDEGQGHPHELTGFLPLSAIRRLSHIMVTAEVDRINEEAA